MAERQKILVLDEKHGRRYIHIPEGRLNNVILEIIKKRHEEGYWYGYLTPDDGDEYDFLQKALEGSTKHAKWFFDIRDTAEYEGWQVEVLEYLLGEDPT